MDYIFNNQNSSTIEINLVFVLDIRLVTEMSSNTRKWQVKCTDLQKVLDEGNLLKEDLVHKLHQMELKVDQYFLPLSIYSFSDAAFEE